MASVKVYRHGDRWAVAQPGAESPAKEYATREEAEVAARQLADGGSVAVEGDTDRGVGGESGVERDEDPAKDAPGARPDGSLESGREVQPGL
jgi:hypothetical protein